jgi:hypothetical protein
MIEIEKKREGKKSSKKTPTKWVHTPFEQDGQLFTAHSTKPVQTLSHDFSVWFLIEARERGRTVI